MVTTSVDDSDLQELNRAIERHMQLNGESAMPWKDMSHPLIIVLAALTLLWFRKGWLVQWCLIGALSLSFYHYLRRLLFIHKQKKCLQLNILLPGNEYRNWWIDLWLTPDQQGQRYFNDLNYLEAAKHFNDPMRKGIAYYYASEFKLAQSEFIEANSDLGWYYAASALARQREYVAARNLLRQLSENQTSILDCLRIFKITYR